MYMYINIYIFMYIHYVFTRLLPISDMIKYMTRRILARNRHIHNNFCLYVYIIEFILFDIFM